MTSQTPLRIDFVSDVACPWCAIGLASLQQALTRLDGTVNAEIHLQPFEVNPQLPPEGEDANERQMGKYGISEEQLEARRAVIRERAAAFGIAFNTHKGSRVYVTFDAHRLLHWAELQNRALALALKRILQRAYFSDDENISNHEVLVRLAREAGLDADAARRVLEGGEYADAVRTQERHFQQAGVHSVPTIIINGQHLISGGQPPEVFEQALRQIAGANGA
ncbi:MAG: DsbA family oxidoreductase [Burkholderiaceae bacterium]|nr:DsbA family oxidoreductase [Burkholderiaceae bacterium]MCP5218024.1 DsbA family oxidoreductase [Burkholderiaceae bacterium]